jgi:hypothetical protein
MSKKLKNIEASLDCGVEGVFAPSPLFLLKIFPPQDQWREKISSFQSIPLPPVGGGATLQTRKNSPPIRKATPHELFGSVLKCSASMIKPESRECGGEIFHGCSGNRASSEFPQSISNKRFAP